MWKLQDEDMWQDPIHDVKLLNLLPGPKTSLPSVWEDENQIQHFHDGLLDKTDLQRHNNHNWWIRNRNRIYNSLKVKTRPTTMRKTAYRINNKNCNVWMSQNLKYVLFVSWQTWFGPFHFSLLSLGADIGREWWTSICSGF